MKLLQLILSRVKQYWVNHRLIFLLFLIGGILSSVMFCYFYGNMSSTMSYRTAAERYEREYEISDLPSEWTATEILEKAELLYEDDLIESVSVEYRLYEHPGGQEMVEDSGAKPGSISAEVGNDVYTLCINGNTDFDKNPNGVAVPDISTKAVGDPITIGGKELTVIGKHTRWDYFVSFDTYRELGIPPDCISVVSVKLHDFANDPIRALLEEVLPGASIDAPDQYEVFVKESAVITMTLLTIVYGSSMLAFMFLLRFLMDANVNSTVISRIVGAKKWQILGLCFGEAAALCALVDAVGIGIHGLLYDSCFSNLNKQEGLIYQPQDYLTIFLSMFCVGMVVALGFVVKYAVLSPAASRRHME